MLIVSTIDRTRGTWARVALGGPVDHQVSYSILGYALGTLLRVRPKGLSVDLKGVDVIGDGGLEVLRGAVLAAADVGSWFELVNAPITVHRRIAEDDVLRPVQAAYAWRRDRGPGQPVTPAVSSVPVP